MLSQAAAREQFSAVRSVCWLASVRWQFQESVHSSQLGPIIATLAGVGVGAAVGGVAGALIGLGIPEYEAKRYESRLNKGGVLLSVHCNTADEIKRAKNLMEGTGAEDISSTTESAVSSDSKTRSAKS